VKAQRRFSAETLRVEDVVVRDGRRAINESVVSQLAESIAQNGLLEPILVTSEHVLIAGAHRLEAFRRIGWDFIEARVAIGIEAVEAEIAELDENLIRTKLTELEERRLWLRRKKLYLRAHPETGHGRSDKASAVRTARKDPDLGSFRQPPSFVTDAAAKLGKSPSVIAAGVKLAEDLSERVDEVVLGTPVASNAAALRRIADEGNAMAQVEKAKEEVERASAPRSAHLRAIEGGQKEPGLRDETKRRDEKIVSMLTTERLTPREVAKRLGIGHSVVQAAKKRNGLAREQRRDPIGRIGETAREFADSLGDLMAAAESVLGTASEDQVASVVEALTELEAKAKELKRRLKKEAGIGAKR